MNKTIIILLSAMLFFVPAAFAGQSPIGSGVLHILGIDVAAEPAEQTVPTNTSTGVKTDIIFPETVPALTPEQIPALPSDYVIVAELSGPGLSSSQTITAKPGEMLMIPPLPQKGTYLLNRIRLMKGNAIVLYAEPSSALINTIDRLLITQVTSRALSIDEIENLGIKINPNNYTAYNFTVGFATESGPVRMTLPVVINTATPVFQPGAAEPEPVRLPPAPELRTPNLHVSGFQLKPQFEEELPVDAQPQIPPLAGAVVIPGNIAFLNQFFEVMLLVTNNAPTGTPLTVSDISAEIVLPAGDDNVPASMDDPLRVAETDAGVQSVVSVLNQKDSGAAIPPEDTGQGKFIVEGLREGAYRVNIDITGRLLGLPTGAITVKGRATGTVLVRNPNFSLTFGHPDIVREGEEYSLFVTVSNTSKTDANLVSLSLYPSAVFGATMLSDSDAETPLGQVNFRTISAGDAAVAEFRFIARRTGRVTAAAFAGADGAKGMFDLRQGVGERGIPLSPDSLILSNYVKHLPADLLYDAMRLLGLAHSVATAPVLPAGVERIDSSVVEQRAYELTEAGLRIKMGEPMANAVYGLLEDWSGGNTSDAAFDDLLHTTMAGNDFLDKADAVINGYIPSDTESGPKVMSVMQLPEADPWDRGRVVAILFDKKIAPESAANPRNYSLLYRTDTRQLRNLPKMAKVLPGRRIIEVYFQSSVSPFFEYDLLLSGIRGLTMKPLEPEPVKTPVVTTLTRAGGVVSGVVRKGDGSPIALTEVFLQEVFTDDEGNPYIEVTNRTTTDDAGNYRIDYVTVDQNPFTLISSDPETGQSGSMSSRILRDRQQLRLDILFLGLGTLTGQVLQAEDQTPVSGAYISAEGLTSGGRYGAVSGPDGRFILKMLPVGNINLSVDNQTHSGAVSAWIGSAGEAADIIFPVYRKAASMGTLQGKVFEGDSRTPVSGVPVTVSTTGFNSWKYTDREGGFAFDAVPAGEVSVSTFRQETGETASGRTTVQVGLQSTVNLVLPGTATIIGTVYDYRNRPVAGAEVLSGVNLVVTDGNGNFVINDVPIGLIELSAAVPGTPDIGTAKVQTGSAGETVRINIILPHTEQGTIRGYVRNADGGPAGYQSVIIYDGIFEPTMLRTDGSGYFEAVMDLGAYTVRTVNSSLTDGDLKEAVLLLDGQIITLNLALKGFGRVTGVVYQPDGVSPAVANVSVARRYYTPFGTPYMKTERFVSDQPVSDGGPSGRYVIENMPLGDFRLEASNAFYSQPVVRSAAINSKGQTLNLDLVLSPTSSVRGQVWLASGDRAGGGLKVNLTPSKSAAKLQAITKEDGTFQFDLVPPEGFTLDVYDPLTGNYGLSRGTVETGDDATVDISLLGKGTVRVKVINGGGDPVAGSSVRISSGSAVAHLLNDFPRLRTDQNGEAVFTNIPEGNFSVTADDPYTLTGGRSGGVISEDLAEVSVTVIVSASGDVKGVIYSADGGSTVPYAQVKLTMSGRPAFYTTSDADGAYLFDFVPLGAFALEVFHPGTGRGGKTSGSVNYDTEVVVADLQLNAQGTVEGFVYTAAGAAVSKARVSIASLDFPGAGAIVMTSNLEGRFRVSGIPEGAYAVYAYDGTRNISGSATGRITTEGELVKTDVYLQATGTIYGRTLASDGVTPVPYANVSLSGPRSGGAVADASGNFSFTTLPMGSYGLYARQQSGLDMGQASASLSHEGQMSNVNIVFIGTGNITGRVQRADGGPLGALPVITLRRAAGDYFNTYPDGEGNFAFHGIPAGNFTISVRLQGTQLGGAYGGTLVGSGADLEGILILIEDSGRITGRVLREDGLTPAVNAVVTCRLMTPDYRWIILYATTASDGTFAFSDVPLGSFSLSVYDYASSGTGSGSGSITSSADAYDLPTITLDEKAPFVTGITPASGSLQVGLNTAVVITFSEPVDPSSVTSSTIRVTGGTSAVSGTIALSSDRKSATFTPLAGFPEFTPVSVTVMSVRDAAGKGMAEMFVSGFTTADLTAPSVLSARLIRGSLVAEFSESVSSGSGSVRLRNTASGEIVTGSLMLSQGNRTVTFNPVSPLPDNQLFEALIYGFTDSSGNVQANEFRTMYLTGDKTPPSLGLSASALSLIEGLPVTITASSASSDLYAVDFRINGTLLQTAYRQPYSVTLTPSSTVTVTATGYDYSGNAGPEASVTVAVSPNGLPAVSIDSPSDGSVTGTARSVAVRVHGSDDLGLRELELRIRSSAISETQVYKTGLNLKSEYHDFVFTVPASARPGADILIGAVARDVRGLESATASIVLHTEDKTAPSVQITSFTQSFHVKIGETVPVNIYASDNNAISRIDFRTEGGLVLSDFVVIDPPAADAVARFNFTVPAGYAGGTRVTIAPYATDVAGNIGYAPKITLVADDITAPVVELTSPQNGAQVIARSNVRVTARASDNEAVDRVEFYVDGRLIATDRAVSNNLYDASFIAPPGDGTQVQVTAKAYDTNGNVSEPAGVTVNVIKDTAAPTVTMTSNLSALRFTEGHAVSISASAADNIGIASAQLLVNNVAVSSIGSPTGSTLLFAYVVERLIPAGAATVKADLEVRVKDFDGNEGTTGIYRIDIVRDALPSVSFRSLRSGGNVLGGSRLRLEAVATDDFGIKSVELRVNGAAISQAASASVSADYDVPVAAVGSTLYIEAVAVDTMDQTSTAAISLNVPVAVSEKQAITISGEALDLAVWADHLYLLKKGGVLSAFDLRPSSGPVETSSLLLGKEYTGLSAYEGVLYVYGPDLVMLDISLPGVVTTLNTYATEAAVTGIGFRMGHAYCALASGKMLVLDIEEPAYADGVAVDMPDLTGLTIEDDMLYTFHGNSSPALRAYSLSDPLQPMALAAYPASPVRLFEYGGMGIGLTGDNRLSSFSLIGPDLQKGSDLTVAGVSKVTALDLWGRYAFISAGADGWAVVDAGGGSLSGMGSVASGGTDRTALHNGNIYAAGATGIKVYGVTTAAAQTPIVRITSPLTGSSVTEGSDILLSAEVTGADDVSVTFFIDGKEMYIDDAAPYGYRFRVSAEATSLALRARACSLNGTCSDSEETLINVTADTSLPVLTITEPEDSTVPQVFEGDTLEVKGRAEDNIGIWKVELLVNGAVVDTTIEDDFVIRYVPADDNLPATDLQLEVAVRATDVSGNTALKAFNARVIQDYPPQITSFGTQPPSIVTANSMLRIYAAASDDRGVNEVRFYDGDMLIGIGTLSEGVYSISYRAPAAGAGGESRTLRAVITDTKGQTAEAAISVAIEADTSLPVVALSTDLSALRFTEGHSVSLAATASDNAGLASVELWVNNRAVSSIPNPASASMTFEYIVEGLIPAGMSTVFVPLEVRATDLNGNVGTSGIYNVEIFPDRPPTVSILSPLSGQNVLGGATIRIEASASDDFGVSRLLLRTNGTLLTSVSSSSVAADYKVPSAAFGSAVSIEAIATDTLGKTGSSLISVNVPARANLLSTISTGAEVLDVAYYAGHAIALEKNIGISIIDVSNPALPVRTGSVAIQGSYSGLRMFEGVAYIYGQDGLTLVDLIDPVAPVLINSFTTETPVLDISFRAGYAYCAMGTGGLMIIDVRDPQNVRAIAP